MSSDAKILFDNAVELYNSLKKEYFNDVEEENIENISIRIKHILEDLRSVLDYIANDIYYRYNKCNNERKIYFPYTKKGKDEEDFERNFNNNLPNVKEKNKQIYIIKKEIQIFSNCEWLTNLMILTNNIKHIKLRINKIKKEKHTKMTDGNTTMSVIGNTEIRQIGGNRYGVFGEGKVFLSGNGSVSFYSNGIIKVGEGTYSINDKKAENLEIDKYEINKLVFENIENEDAQKIMEDIFKGIKKLINNIEDALL